MTDVSLFVGRSTSMGALSARLGGMLIRPSGSQFFDPRVQAAQSIQAMQMAETTRRQEEYLQYGEIQAHQGTSVADAWFQGVQGQREGRSAQMNVQTEAIKANADRSIAMMKIDVKEQNDQAQARLQRDPYMALGAAYGADMSRTQFLPEDQRAGAQNAAASRYYVGLQEIKDRQLALGGSQALQLGITGILAHAVGPGANQMRRGAEILGMAGGAELNAQTILRDESLGNSQERLKFANNARQLGINQLEAYRANYLQNFSSRSASRFEIAPGNQDSTRPESVMRQIDDGIRSLSRNMGNGDISGSKTGSQDSVPGLLNQILQTLQTGALRATD
jgi:hypothetical protein